MPAIGATINALRRTCAPILMAAAWRCTNENEGSEFYPHLRRKRMRALRFVVLRKRRRPVDHAARKKAPRTGQDVERGEPEAAREPRDAARAGESACEQIRGANRRERIEPAARSVARERSRFARILDIAQD